MMNLLVGAALLGAAYAQNNALPQIDLGYEIYQAAGFNVCSLNVLARSIRASKSERSVNRQHWLTYFRAPATSTISQTSDTQHLLLVTCASRLHRLLLLTDHRSTRAKRQGTRTPQLFHLF